MPQVNHSWLAPIVAGVTDEETEDRVETLVAQWIQKEATRMFPRLPMVGRIVREALLPMMECEATEAFLDANPQWNAMVMATPTPREAATLGAMECLADEMHLGAAEAMLIFMQDGLLMPDPETMAQMLAATGQTPQ